MNRTKDQPDDSTEKGIAGRRGRTLWPTRALPLQHTRGQQLSLPRDSGSDGAPARRGGARENLAGRSGELLRNSPIQPSSSRLA